MGRSNKAPDADGDFYNAPYLNVNDDRFYYNSNDVDNPNENYGTASAFVPSAAPSVCD